MLLAVMVSVAHGHQHMDEAWSSLPRVSSNQCIDFRSLVSRTVQRFYMGFVFSSLAITVSLFDVYPNTL